MSNKGPDSNQCSIKIEKLDPIIYHSSKLLLCRLHRLSNEILCCKKNIKEYNESTKLNKKNIKKYNESSKLKEKEMVNKEIEKKLCTMFLILYIVSLFIVYLYYRQWN
ncbi:hypothetical protein HERIO_1243 [Hepatospora eriocheir]|uniref:Uncharacterized protein n=1 Tax=Hepatospora eriocheir TaxID=1081669 RepID=A0A1X0QAP9_9MICR|nr:hypothetical protein HERIO_1243 [Hepatospora eriocheir]